MLNLMLFLITVVITASDGVFDTDSIDKKETIYEMYRSEDGMIHDMYIEGHFASACKSRPDSHNLSGESTPAGIMEHEGIVYTIDLSTDIMPTTEDVILLAQLTYAEAGNQDELGQRYVIDAVLNRIENPNCPETISGVIYQPGQFSTAHYVVYQPVVPEIVTLVYEELETRTNDEVFFFGCYGYSAYGTPMFQYGAHYFSKY